LKGGKLETHILQLLVALSGITLFAFHSFQQLMVVCYYFRAVTCVFLILFCVQVMQMITVNCLCVCGYRNEFNTEADSCSSTEDDDNDNAFHEEWIWLGPKDVNISSYVSVDNDLETWLLQH
jgi:hypothetical protein